VGSNPAISISAVYTLDRSAGDMATSKTGSFWLTENIQTATATGGLMSGTLDLG